MSTSLFLSSSLRRRSTCIFRQTTRAYASAPKAKGAAKPPSKTAIPMSSCKPDTVLTGVNYLKGQPPVLALPDDQYPEWLWGVLEERVWPDDGPGGRAERAARRKENKLKIRDSNFMKTQ
ncbi:mitochondrial ribosomal protein L37-domain-containing protein [Mycena rebaudengoi]|nr:mitochondrial ribosomal protein L37-domain-containing protein [Mycena rebaudengoi]